MERVFFVKLNGKYQRAPKPWETAAVIKSVEHIKDISERKMVARGRGFQVVYDTLADGMEIMRQLALERGRKAPLTTQEFLDCYVGSKKKVFTAVAVKAERRPFDISKASKVQCFTKDEYCKEVPRIIQPRSPEFNLQLGRWIKHLEHSIYMDLDLMFDNTGKHVTVQKGRTHIERGNAIHKAWKEFKNPVAIELDAARFDQHLNAALLMTANAITEWYSQDVHVSGLTKLRSLLNAQILNKGRFYGPDGVIKYSVDGCGMSGDMNTSLRNVVIMCLGMYSYLNQVGVKYRYGNDGDDGWLIVEAKDLGRVLEPLENWFLKLGLTMKVEGIKYHLEDIEFCQGKPVYNEDHGYILVPKPQKRLYSDLVSTKDLSSRKIFNKWMGAVAGCGLAQTVGVPVLQNHYRWIAKAATPWIPGEGDIYYRHSWWNANNLPVGKRVFRTPTQRERISFYEAFGITPDAQRSLERHYDELPAQQWNTPEPGLRTFIPPLFRAYVQPVQADKLVVHPYSG
jgi:hypothetical protein